MPFPDLMLEPVRRQLTDRGVRELRSAADVDDALGRAGTAVVAVNSMCGCSSMRMRPAFLQALEAGARPDEVLTVFAGQDHEATARARSYFRGFAPSSPSVFLLRDGEVVWALERKDIDRRAPEDIARDIREAFARFCGGPAGDVGAAADPRSSMGTGDAAGRP